MSILANIAVRVFSAKWSYVLKKWSLSTQLAHFFSVTPRGLICLRTTHTDNKHKPFMYLPTSNQGDTVSFLMLSYLHLRLNRAISRINVVQSSLFVCIYYYYYLWLIWWELWIAEPLGQRELCGAFVSSCLSSLSVENLCMNGVDIIDINNDILMMWTAVQDSELERWGKIGVHFNFTCPNRMCIGLIVGPRLSRHDNIVIILIT